MNTPFSNTSKSRAGREGEALSSAWTAVTHAGRISTWAHEVKPKLRSVSGKSADFQALPWILCRKPVWSSDLLKPWCSFILSASTDKYPGYPSPQVLIQWLVWTQLLNSGLTFISFSNVRMTMCLLNTCGHYVLGMYPVIMWYKTYTQCQNSHIRTVKYLLVFVHWYTEVVYILN